MGGGDDPVCIAGVRIRALARGLLHGKQRHAAKEKSRPSGTRPAASVLALLENATTLQICMKGLPLAYNKDLQETQEPLFDAADTLLFPCCLW